MEENAESNIQSTLQRSLHSDCSPSELRFKSFHGGNGGISTPKGKPDPRALSTVGSNAAKYKSMSPVRLPISRSSCLTIPPGFSPTKLLESPVLLSNMKAEPSPTTGTLSMPPIMPDTVGSNTLTSPRETTNSSTHDEGRSDGFEFKPNIKLSSGSISSFGPLNSEPFVKVQGPCQSQTFASSPLVTTENVLISSQGLMQSVTALNPPVHTLTLRATAPAEVTSADPRQSQGSENGIQVPQSDHRGSSPLVVAEKSSEDGYNWRKYGQKYVKGSEFPRSYYKCTHPNCQMKKQLERSHDGQITEIIYKGIHDHPKPQPSRRLAVGTVLSNQEERSDRFSLLSAEASDGDPEAPCAQAKKNTADADADADDPESKRRKIDIGVMDITPLGKTTREPRVVVQTLSEVDILDDGYRWRKYGQKVVKGNPNPRSYYKCTNAGCPVRKHVERASHDPKSVITTYEGKHNHDVPNARTSSHDSAGPMSLNGTFSLKNHMPIALNSMSSTNEAAKANKCHDNPSEEIDVISLNLGVGISSNHENRSDEKQHTLDTEQIQNQIQIADSNYSTVIQAPVSAYYDSSKNGGGHYESREDTGENFSFLCHRYTILPKPYGKISGEQ